MPNRYTISKETRLKLAIESKLGWGTSENWSTKDFQNLSKYIEEATGVLLSVTTLKRFFGKVNAETSPSSSTLDTLSVFLGYQSWLAFSENGRHQLYASPRKSLFTYLLKIPPAFIPYGKILLLIGILAGLALISGFFIQFEGGLSLPEDIPFEIK